MQDWDRLYTENATPWNTSVPEPELVSFICSGRVSICDTLEIGAGTGTDARWLAKQGFDVLGIDLAPQAVKRARGGVTSEPAAHCQFAVADFLREPPKGAFSFVYDRACFHMLSDPAAREQFAANVARVLESGGVWLSLIGSTEGSARNFGPPRRTALEIVMAVEPFLAIQELAAVKSDRRVQIWRLVAQLRT